MRMLLVILVFPAMLWGQVNDRRLVESQAFDRAEAIKNRAESTWWRSGLFGIDPGLALLDLGYESNVLLRETNEQDDVLGSPEAKLETYYIISPRWIWENTGTYRYRYYEELDGLRTSESGLQSTFYGMFRKAYFEGGYSRFDDQGRQTSELADRISSTRERFFAEAVLQVLPRGHLIAEGRLSSIDYEETAGSIRFLTLEREEQVIDVGYLHKIRPDFWPFLGASRREFDFEVPGNPRDDSRFTGIYAGFRNETGGRLHYDVRMGSDDLVFDLAPAAEDTVWTGRAVVNYRLTRLTSVSVGGFSNPLFSLTRDYAYFISTRVFASLTRRLARDSRLNASLLLGSNAYENPIVPVAIDRDDDVLSLRLDYSLDFARSFDISLRAAYEERDSNRIGLSYEGYSITSDIRYKFR